MPEYFFAFTSSYKYNNVYYIFFPPPDLQVSDIITFIYKKSPWDIFFYSLVTHYSLCTYNSFAISYYFLHILLLFFSSNIEYYLFLEMYRLILLSPTKDFFLSTTSSTPCELNLDIYIYYMFLSILLNRIFIQMENIKNSKVYRIQSKHWNWCRILFVY